MSEIINNTASTNYTFNGSSTVNTANSNTLPVNLQTSTGLVISKTANPTTFSAGSIITYTVNITNSSGHYLNGVRIIDNLGNGNLAYVLSSASLTYNGQSYPVTPISTNPLTFTLQQLPVGASMTLTYRSQVIFNLPPFVSNITNSIKGIGYTSTGTINGFANSTISKTGTSNFSITKSSNTTDVGENEVFRYFITLSNNTSTPVSVSSITDNLPSNYTLLSISLRTGSGSETILSNSDYTLSSGNLLTIPSSTGPNITVPANGTTVVTLTGYLS